MGAKRQPVGARSPTVLNTTVGTATDSEEALAVKQLLNTSPTPRRGPLDVSTPATANAGSSSAPDAPPADAAPKDSKWGALKKAMAAQKAEKKAAEPPPPKLAAVVDAAVAAAYSMSRAQIEAVEQRWLDEAAACEQRARDVPVDFDRQLGLAIAALAPSKAAFLELMDSKWDKAGAGMKKVDFRRNMRGTHAFALKMTNASNSSVDALFDAVTGGGGGAVAKVKELHHKMWPSAERAKVPDPQAEALEREAESLRAEAAAVHTTLEALLAAEAADEQLHGQTGDAAPVVAQIGALVLKRNMKVGEVMAKWGDVDRKSFREHVIEMGVKSTTAKIDAVFDELDDDGGGSLDMEELKSGMKLLIDSAKQAVSSNAGLEKKAAGLRTAAANQINALAKKEKARAEELRAKAVEAEIAEKVRKEAAAAAAAEAAKAKHEAEERKKAEKVALMEKINAQKKAAGMSSKSNSPSGASSEQKVSTAEINANKQRDAETQYLALIQSWGAKPGPKRKWRRHDSWRQPEIGIQSPTKLESEE